MTDGLTHIPVLLKETLSAVEGEKPKNLLDCTFGGGGHSVAFLSRYPKLKALALDRDKSAIERGKGSPPFRQNRMEFSRDNFSRFPEKLKKSPSLFKEYRPFDIILMDLGPSSPQLDQEERGFSFYRNGPLDMRMDQEDGVTAEDLVNGLSKKELNRLFQELGEIKHPFPVTDAIFKQRRLKRIQTTGELVRLIEKFAPKSRSRLHPATPYFLALRIQVNGELEGLKCLPDFLPFLANGGRFIVISFHSLEDRMVKGAFKRFVQDGRGALWSKKAITPSPEERRFNLRSRSAKLRIFIKRS